MRFGKAILVFPVAALLIGSLFGSVHSFDDSKVDLVAQIPEPSHLGVSLMPESSGELWRREVRSADGKRVAEVHVAYRDKRVGAFYFDGKGKLSRYTSTGVDSGRIVYEAEFGNKASIVHSRSLRADGSLEAEVKRSADGSEERVFFADDGLTVVRSLLTRADGSQKIISIADGKTVETELKAEPSEKIVRLSEDGSAFPQLRIQLVGARMQSWSYFDADEKLRHTGQFDAEGNIQVTVFGDDDEWVLKQSWVRIGEDWNRAFYRLAQVDINQTGSLARAVLYEDGVTVKEVYNLLPDGNAIDRIVCDRRGVPIRYESLENGVVTSSNEMEETESVTLEDAGIEAGAKDPGGPFYRFGGVPFADPVSPVNGFFRIKS